MLSSAFSLLATPVFGLALQFSPNALLLDLPDADLGQNLSATSAASNGEESGSESSPTATADTQSNQTKAQENPAKDPVVSAANDEEYVLSLKERARFAKIHRWFGIASFVSMGLTVILGTIQYYNLYGFFAGQDSNPCVSGDAVFGQGQCTGYPWPHALASALTGGLYFTTFSLSLLMPDPDHADEGDSEFAQNLRLHKLLRWVHLGGMVAQIALGVLIANGTALGLDRANDYGALQALATVYWGVGLLTWGTMGWAGWLML